MAQQIRGNLVFAWMAVLTTVLAFVAFGHAASERKTADFDEINVHRINVIEPDGKPRVIIASRERMAGIYLGGKEYRHPTRDEGGFLFFNDDGDEVGGMGFSNRRKGDGYQASSSLLFDQYKQDQTLGLMYDEQDGQRQAGLGVWDRPDKPLAPVIELSDQLARATTEAQRAKIRAQIDAIAKSWGPHPAPVRLFAGKVLEDSIVRLSDGQGRPRLVLKVDKDGAASIDFLDEAGKLIRRIM
jgi:hypothetical protein